MARRGRPANAVRPVVVSVKLLLYPGQDDDLIAYLTGGGPRLRATLVKLALREGRMPLHPPQPEEDDLDFDGLLQ